MMAADPTGGYWTVTPAGAVTPHGAAPALGSPALSNLRLAQPIVGMAATTDGNGYWLVASDGGIFSYGDATFYGSTGAIHLNKPIVGMAATNDGRGYWLVASDGGIFSYGDATFYGSTGSIALNKPVVGMAVTTDGGGYWLVASDGGIFSYGDAYFYGSTGSIRLNLPIVGMAPTPDGRGYSLVAFDGGIFTFGDADFYGSTAGWGVYAYGMIINPATAGYDVVTANGASVAFGPGLHPNAQSAGLQQGAYDSTPTPSGMAAFAQETEHLADRGHRLPAFQRRLVGPRRQRRLTRLADRAVEGQRLHALARRTRCSRPAVRTPWAPRHRGDGRLRQLLHDARSDPRRRWSGQRVPAARLGVRRLVDGLVRRRHRAPRPASPRTSSRSSRRCGPWQASSSDSSGTPMPGPSPSRATRSRRPTRGTPTWTSSASMPTTSPGPRRRHPTNAWSSTMLPVLTPGCAAVRLGQRQTAGFLRMGRDHPERRPRPG